MQNLNIKEFYNYKITFMIKNGLLLVIASSLIISGCAQPKVSYTDSNAVDTTSIGWGSTDLQNTTKKMLDSFLTSPSIKRITDFGKVQPVVFFSGVQNQTNQYINTSMLENMVSTRITNSGMFQFTDMNQVKAMKKQMEYQQDSGMVNQNTAVQMGQQIGAEYMFSGSVANIQQSNSSQESMYFLITLKLTNLKLGTIVWQGEKQIRKVKEKSTFGW